jgi:hypothetical protein
MGTVNLSGLGQQDFCLHPGSSVLGGSDVVTAEGDRLSI